MYDCPSTDSLTMYTPGTTSGPSGDGGVRPGLALISNECVKAGGGSYRKSQFVRFVPMLVESASGGAIQKLGSRGRAASGTGGGATLERWRTSRPLASEMSSMTSVVGRLASTYSRSVPPGGL